MQQWSEHSLYGYFTRLSTYKLERILDTRHSATGNSLLQAEDYAFIHQILQSRPDSRLFLQDQSQDITNQT